MSTALLESPTSAEEIARKVTLGALELDKVRSNWWEKIDSHRLDMRDGVLCILGQLDGSFTGAKRVLGWSYEECDALGFYWDRPEGLSDSEWENMYDPYYAEAKECWLGEIADRLVGDK